MKPFSRSIVELFDGKKRYLIPLFQRQYVWKEEPQLSRIWDDIRSKFELRIENRQTYPHFLGAIVISQLKTFGKQVQSYDVIDGQQRLSTFQILLCAFRDAAVIVSPEFSEELQKYIVNDGVMEDKAVERYKLWPTQVDRAQLKQMVDAKAGSIEVEQPKGKGVVIPNMIGAHHFFFEKIQGLLNDPSIDMPIEQRVEELFSVLKNDLALVSIELEGGDDPQVIFETLNGFGQPLLPTDLMRNYIFQIAYRDAMRISADKNADSETKTPEDLYSEYWLPLDQPFWKKEEKQGRIKRARVDNFFMHFLAMKKGSDINVGRLFHEYRHWIEDKKPYSDVESLLVDTANAAALYQDIVEPGPDSPFQGMSKVLSVFDVSTIVPLLLYLGSEKQLDRNGLGSCLEMLESFLVRRAICNLTNKNYNRLFIQFIEQIRGAGDKVEALRGALARAKAEVDTAFWPDDATFLEKWQSRSIYNDMPSPRIQFVLSRIEGAMRTSKSEEFSIKSQLSVEHIMPVEWPKHWPLKDGRVALSKEARLAEGLVDMEASARDHTIHTFGNLTLLTQPLNSSVGNGPWPEKKSEILQHSALAISRGLIDADIWDENAIAERSTALFAYAAKVWESPLVCSNVDQVALSRHAEAQV